MLQNKIEDLEKSIKEMKKQNEKEKYFNILNNIGI